MMNKTRSSHIGARCIFGCLALLLDSVAVAQVDRNQVEAFVSIERRLHAIELDQKSTVPFSVLVTSTQGRQRLRTVSIRLDEESAADYHYAQPEWDAVAKGAAHLAWQGRLSPGRHRLRLEVSARDIDANPNDARTLEWIDQDIDVLPGAALMVTFRQKRFGRAALEVTPVDAIAVAAPSAQYWLWSGRPFMALRHVARGMALSNSENEPLAALLQQGVDRFTGIADATDADSQLVSRAQDYDDAMVALAQGAAESMQAMAELEAQTETQWVVRDHANLALGYHYLRSAQAEKAREFLGRVRSPGPRSSEALLGYGWTFLISEIDTVGGADRPDAEPLAHVNTASALIQSADPDLREKALRAALVPWTQLIGVDPLDVAAQEGALAVAWALDELGTGAQAHDYLGRAAGRLEMARSELSEAMEHVGSGAAAEAFAAGQNDEQSGWRIWLSDLPWNDKTAYFAHLIKHPGFVLALDDYRAARQIDDAWSEQLLRIKNLAARGVEVSELEALVRNAQGRHAPGLLRARLRMERLALDQLRAMKARVEAYLAHARFAIARQFDRQTDIEELAWIEASP